MIMHFISILGEGTRLINVLENVYGLSIAILLLCSFFYVKQLKKIKRKENSQPLNMQCI